MTLSLKAASLFTAFLMCGAGVAQETEFEVATIKPSPPPTPGRMMIGTRGGPGTDDPGRFTCTNCTVKRLLLIAYDLSPIQISGPPVLDSEHFEVVAKVPPGASMAQFRQMMQKLLADRFKLVAHREEKEMPGYRLVVAKNGPKLAESGETPDAAPAGPPPPPGPPRMDKDGYPVLPAGRGGVTIMMPGRARMRGVKETMDQLARRLTDIVGQVVTNATGLSGKYDYTLSWSPDMSRMPALPPGMPPPGGEPGMPSASVPQESGPTIFTAVQEQLGLRLEQRKGPVETLVIDHVEKAPTEN